MTYVMSDIHGEKRRFDEMLEKIGFSDGDTLYIIGDVIDRGEQGVEILEEIMDRKNVKLLMGNHELMCLSSMTVVKDLLEVARWANNGGRPTAAALNARTPVQRHRILKYMKSAPEFLDVEVGDRKFHLVHAGPGRDREERLWVRPSPFMPSRYKDRRVIVGHTPVMYFQPSSSTYLAKIGPHMRIFHCDAFIGIDCGCGMPANIPKQCLACLRLDDMEEFYVV